MIPHPAKRGHGGIATEIVVAAIGARLAGWMTRISKARHQFPPSVIQQAVRLYLRFMLSYRDVEELLAERGLKVSYETARRWVLKSGPAIAQQLRRR